MLAWCKCHCCWSCAGWHKLQEEPVVCSSTFISLPRQFLLILFLPSIFNTDLQTAQCRICPCICCKGQFLLIIASPMKFRRLSSHPARSENTLAWLCVNGAYRKWIWNEQTSTFYFTAGNSTIISSCTTDVCTQSPRPAYQLINLLYIYFFFWFRIISYLTATLKQS